MGVTVLWARARPGDWLVLSLSERAGSLAVCVIGGMTVYFLVCYLLGLTPASLRGPPPGGDR
jgi:hypothetical protein